MNENKATKQADVKASPISGVAPPKNRQFGQPNGNPRHNGAWKKEDTARYKLERMMELTEDELLAVATDSKAPYFERKLARCINAGQWNEIQGMLNQVYGYPKQAIETTEIEPPVPLSPRKQKGKK